MENKNIPFFNLHLVWQNQRPSTILLGKTFFRHILRTLSAFSSLILYSDIDWTKPIEFLDKELRQVTKDARTGRRFVDALVKVYRIDGAESWLYIHIEIQNQYDAHFEQRMYIYNYRIYDRFKHPIVSLAILGDDDINWRPDHFILEEGRTIIRFDFPIIKLLDYKERWSELEADRNPFAIVVMVHLRTLETTNNRQARKEFKLALMKRLYEQGYNKQDIINLYELIDWVMTLPKDLQAKLDQQITQYEEERKMPYVSSIEKSGKLKGKQDLIIQQLNGRVGKIQQPLIDKICKLSVKKLELLGLALFDLSSVTELEAWLQNKTKPVEKQN